MSGEPTKRRRFWRHPAVLLLVVAFAVLALLAAVPLIGSAAIMVHWAAKERSPADDIAQLVERSFELGLPAGSTVVVSHRVEMGMDSAGAYEVDIPAGALPEFLEQLRAAAGKRGFEVKETSVAPFIANPPPWWTTGTAGIDKWLELLRPTAQAYQIGISPSTGRCFIYWMTF